MATNVGNHIGLPQHLKTPDKGAAERVAPTQPMNIPKTNNPKPDLF